MTWALCHSKCKACSDCSQVAQHVPVARAPWGVLALLPEIDWHIGKKHILPGRTLQKMYFLNFFFLGTMNVQCKNQEKHTLCEHIFWEKNTLALRSFTELHIFIVITGNIVTKCYCTDTSNPKLGKWQGKSTHMISKGSHKHKV